MYLSIPIYVLVYSQILMTHPISLYTTILIIPEWHNDNLLKKICQNLMQKKNES